MNAPELGIFDRARASDGGKDIYWCVAYSDLESRSGEYRASL
jgi:hypothetical protein